MEKFKYFFIKYKRIILIVGILIICSIAIALGVYAQITNKGVKIPESQKIEENYEDLKNNFQDIFTNSINKETTANLNINYEELLYTRYDIKNEKSGRYIIEAKIPGFKEDTKVLKKINEDIYDIYANEILKIVNTATVRTTFNLEYVAYVNGNVISLVIMCKYKDGTNAQRNIVQCYNYDIEKDKLLSINDAIEYKQLDKDQMQKKVKDEIKKVNNQNKNISEQGYNVYIRDEDDLMYQIDNTPNFFFGKNNYLYLVYSYGNNNYTSEIDLVIF